MPSTLNRSRLLCKSLSSPPMLSSNFHDFSVSHGTLKTEDLIRSFVDFFQQNAPDSTDPEHKKTFNALVRKSCVKDACAGKWDNPKVDIDEKTSESLEYALETLYDLLDSIAPEGTYFGSHEGDASDFGFWSYTEEN